MKAVFADTFYFLALLNRRDPFHLRAATASRTAELSIVTTEFVLLELADALCKPPQRQEVTTSAGSLKPIGPSDWSEPRQNFSSAQGNSTRTVPTKTGRSPTASHLWSCRMKGYVKH
jgi:hypothetical protein